MTNVFGENGKTIRWKFTVCHCLKCMHDGITYTHFLGETNTTNLHHDILTI